MYGSDVCIPCNLRLFLIYGCREEYQKYLKRPDLKQVSVSQWQKDYNSIPADMREDEETKVELHLRLDVNTTSVLNWIESNSLK